MSEYTPASNVVRDAYVRAMRNAFIAGAVEHEQEFDRWLTAVKAEAWDEGANWGLDEADWQLEHRPMFLAENPYREAVTE